MIGLPSTLYQWSNCHLIKLLESFSSRSNSTCPNVSSPRIPWHITSHTLQWLHMPPRSSGQKPNFFLFILLSQLRTSSCSSTSTFPHQHLPPFNSSATGLDWPPTPDAGFPEFSFLHLWWTLNLPWHVLTTSYPKVLSRACCPHLIFMLLPDLCFHLPSHLSIISIAR